MMNTLTVSPTKTTTYAVACGNSAATGVTANVTVVVTPVVSPSTTVAPTITTISPTTAAIGQTVTITGTGFTSKNSIHFGSTWVGPIASTNGTTLTFTVPTSAGGCDPLTFIGDMPCTAPVVQPGSYTVTVNSLPAGTTTPQTSNGVAFTVSTGVTTATAPTITAISPTTAAIGQTVAITGTGFTSANSVHVGSAWVGPIASTNNGTTLTFVVPTSSGVCDPLSSVANPASACTMQAVVLTPGAYTVTVNSLSTGATAPLASNGVSLTISGGVSTALSATLTASQTTVQSGQPVTLTWSSQNATYCTGVGFSTGGGAIYNTSALSSSAGGMNYQYTSGSGATSGSVVVYPTQTTTYGLMCGAANSSATVNASALVSVSSVTTKPACGSANGTTVASLPTANLCSVGIATQVSGSGPWTWNCVSSTASTAGAVSCSANKSSTTASSVDLIAGTVTPTTATVNTPAVLSAPIYNVGTASTVSGFTDRFEINSTTVPTSAASVATLRTNTSTALNAGGNTSVSISYLFPSVGTYYVRACANTTLNGTNTITESNSANNCGVWSPVTVR